MAEVTFINLGSAGIPRPKLVPLKNRDPTDLKFGFLKTKGIGSRSDILRFGWNFAHSLMFGIVPLVLERPVGHLAHVSRGPGWDWGGRVIIFNILIFFYIFQSVTGLPVAGNINHILYIHISQFCFV